jgi:hypothetical protein
VDQNYWNVGRQGFACVQVSKPALEPVAELTLATLAPKPQQLTKITGMSHLTESTGLLACVQGLVALTDVHEGTGGLVLFPGNPQVC